MEAICTSVESSKAVDCVLSNYVSDMLDGSILLKWEGGEVEDNVTEISVQVSATL